MPKLVSPRCTDPLLRGSPDEQLACKRVLENKIEDENKEGESKINRILWENLEDPASQDEMGLLRTMSSTERKERRRTATPTLTSNTINGDEVSGELTASTLLEISGGSFFCGSFRHGRFNSNFRRPCLAGGHKGG